MKRFVTVIVAVLMLSSLAAYSQNVTGKYSNASIGSIFNDIEKQTGFSIIYDAALVDASAKVSVNFSRTPVSQAVLQIVNSGLKCEVRDKMLVIFGVPEQDNQAYSQTAQVKKNSFSLKGNVKDENGEPLIGAGVIPQGNASAGTITDVNGNFSLSLPSGEAIIDVSYLGYATKSIVVGGRHEIMVSLEVDKENVLNEVVVIGYGSTQRQDLTGSVASVKMGNIKDIATLSVDQALQGRIAGVDIMSTSGEPASGSSIRIRGTRSITASNV